MTLPIPVEAVGQRDQAWAEGSRIYSPLCSSYSQALPHPHASLLISLTEPDSCLSVRQQHAQESGPITPAPDNKSWLISNTNVFSFARGRTRGELRHKGMPVGAFQEDFLPWQSITERRPFSICSFLQSATLWNGASCHSNHQTPWGKRSRESQLQVQTPMSMSQLLEQMLKPPVSSLVIEEIM